MADPDGLSSLAITQVDIAKSAGTGSGQVVGIRGEHNRAAIGRASGRSRFTLRLRDYNALEQVLHRVRQSGAAIKELELEPPDLEDVFLRVMEKH